MYWAASLASVVVLPTPVAPQRGDDAPDAAVHGQPARGLDRLANLEAQPFLEDARIAEDGGIGVADYGADEGPPPPCARHPRPVSVR